MDEDVAGKERYFHIGQDEEWTLVTHSDCMKREPALVTLMLRLGAAVPLVTSPYLYSRGQRHRAMHAPRLKPKKKIRSPGSRLLITNNGPTELLLQMTLGSIKKQPLRDTVRWRRVSVVRAVLGTVIALTI
jgi:hypothetical protein